MDCFQLMNALADASVDMILTDPPYGVHEAEWDTVVDIDRMWAEFKRVIKPRRAIVITCVMGYAWKLIAANPAWFKYDMVGQKTHATDFVNAHNKPMRAHENILVFSSGTTANKSPNRMAFYPQMSPGEPYKKFNYGETKSNSVFGGMGRKSFSKDGWDISNGERYPTTVILQKSMDTSGNLHPNQKPLDLFEYLIRTYTLPGDLILDPFAGSGTTLVAARNLGRRYIGGDITAEYVAVAKRRLSEPFTPPLFIELAVHEPLPVTEAMWD